MIYFLFDPEDKTDRNNYIQHVGEWSNLLIGSVDEGQMLYLKLPNLVVVPKEVALAYQFVGKYKGYIKLRDNTLHKAQLGEGPFEQVGEKFKYVLTEEDKKNACLFQKAAMMFMLEKYYSNKLLLSKNTPDFLKEDGFKSEEYLLNKKNEIYQKIISCQDWVEAGILLNNHFGVHYDADTLSKIDL